LRNLATQLPRRCEIVVIVAAMTMLTERFKHQPTWAAVTEIFIGLGWLRAAAAKSIDARWWDGSVIRDFLADHEGVTLSWYQPFTDVVVSPNAVLFAALVLALQLLIAASLLSSRHRLIGLAAGVGLNLHFVAAGAVNPSAFYLLAQGALVLWILEEQRRLPSADSLLLAAGSSLAVVGFNLPFVRTLDPETVIDDPAIMMATVGSLTALACLLMADRAADPEHRVVFANR